MNSATKFKKFLDRKKARKTYLKNVKEQCNPDTPVAFLLQLFRGYPEDCYIAGAFVKKKNKKFWKNTESEWDKSASKPQNTK